MIAMVFTVCLIAQPAKCHEEFNGEGDLMGCLVNTQTSAAKWVSQHPTYFVKEIKCRPALDEA